MDNYFNDMNDQSNAFEEQVFSLHEKLEHGIITLFQSCKTKDEMKGLLRRLGNERTKKIVNFSLPKEHYEICQAAKEVLEEQEKKSD